MKKMIKKSVFVLKDIVDTNIHTIRGLSRYLFSHKYLTTKNFQTLDKKNVIVLGNGPSLKNIDLERINRENTYIACVNDFPAKSNLFFSLKPEFLVLLDPAYYEMIVKIEEENVRQLLSILNKVDWKLTVIAPCKKRLAIENHNINYQWINTFSLLKEKPNTVINWMYKNNIANFGYRNVIHGALYYFITQIEEKIYIAGVDMSEFKDIYVDENNRKYVESTHFYGKTRKYYDDMPEYGFNELYTILDAYQKMFLEFSLAAKYAEHMGVAVYNLTADSYVDAFDKRSPQDIYLSTT